MSKLPAGAELAAMAWDLGKKEKKAAIRPAIRLSNRRNSRFVVITLQLLLLTIYG